MKKSNIIPSVNDCDLIEFVCDQLQPDAELRYESGALKEEHYELWSKALECIKAEEDYLYVENYGDTPIKEVDDYRIRSVETSKLKVDSYYKKFADFNNLTGIWYILFTD